jgi:glycosyltransferase involved in cell wall biosynthesis
MPYDGPGGYCRVVFDLCRMSRRSEPRVAVMGAGRWTARLRRAGTPVTDVSRIMKARTVAERVRKLDALVRDIDVLNIHIGPVLEDRVRAFAELVPVPAVFTLHWGFRIPVRNSRIICTSREIVALQAGSNHCDVIENAVDLAQFHPAPRGAAPTDPVIIRVCRADRSAHYFWDAVEPVLRRHPRAKVWIVGETGPSTPQVKYWGYRDDVPALLRRATILAYAPRPGEGTRDLSILEAMASGVVPVVTDVQCASAITSGRDGVLVPYGDVLAFERALERAVADPRRLQRMARAARRTVQRDHDIRVVARAYERIYADLLTPRGSGTRATARAGR